ncbi:hypothetical protein TEA_027566 [Camellia sinensis var. sinensis]|uniref:Uncharacterized protein n=1 Tax=Camellia sinensis var. sinensis TaxID=542762 RepID=A0A4S4F199_CAMSN|nr:hypothetical protein TEA_027566 [Camellia sinensis var. sinensis]
MVATALSSLLIAGDEAAIVCYALFGSCSGVKPMHEMWKGYMVQLLKNVGENQLTKCLLTADLHGAMILVVQCKIAAFTGVSGIMIRETEETFGIITQDNKFRAIDRGIALKQNSSYLFAFHLRKSNNGIEFQEIHFQPSSESQLRSSTTMRNQMR